jgi:beta-glucosidase
MIKFSISFIVLILLFGCASETTNPAAIPVHKLDEPWWNTRHQEVLNKLKSDPQLILIGNSILHSLDNEDRQEIWTEYLNQYNAVNMGFSGDRTENVIWRIRNGEIDGINPKLALLLIGTNNTDGNHYLKISTPQELEEAIWEICEIIREKLPQTQILLLGILPYGYKPNHRDNINRATNELIADFPGKDPNIHYRNINNVYLDSKGKVMKELMPDYLHPNAKGHLLMFEKLEHDITQLMKK